jgi:hypothetical protein
MRSHDSENDSRDPLSDIDAERLLRAALTLRRMPPETASSIAVVDLDGSADDVAATATRIANALELVPFVIDGDGVSVRFERSA